MTISDRQRFVLGLLGILIVYTCYYVFFDDNFYFVVRIPRRLRQLSRFVPILMVYAIGSWALHPSARKWMLQVWHFIHIVLLALLLLIGGWDFLIAPTSYSFRLIAIFIHEFLISPVLYVGMGILRSKLPKKFDPS